MLLGVAYFSILITSSGSHPRCSMVSVLPKVSWIHREKTDHFRVSYKILSFKEPVQLLLQVSKVVPRFPCEWVLHAGTSAQKVDPLAALQLAWWAFSRASRNFSGVRKMTWFFFEEVTQWRAHPMSIDIQHVHGINWLAVWQLGENVLLALR